MFWGADLRGAMFRDVDLSRVTISHARLVDVDIDAVVERIVINGVDVTAYVNERDPWYPLRAMIEARRPGEMRATWEELEREWAATIEAATTLPAQALHTSVNDEWSFVQTVRHIVFAIDKWFTAPVTGGAFHPIGLPNTGSLEFPWPGLDLTLEPSADEALAARSERAFRVAAHLASVSDGDLARKVDVLENGPHSIAECIVTVFEEAFWHLRYARRDLALTSAG